MSKLRLKLKQFGQLSFAEQRLFLLALILLPLIAAGLRLFGFKRCQNALQRLTPQARTLDHSDDLARAHTSARLVNAAARYGPYRARCLVRSMTLQVLLRRSGIDNELVIGVRRSQGCFEAHAWLQLGAHTLDTSAQDFTAFRPL
jgi:hypothetical protein